MSSKQKTFKEYYQDPKFRERHIQYMSEKVTCEECGQITSRSNMTKHRKTDIHNRLAKQKKRMSTKIEIDLLKEQLNLLQKNIKMLEAKNNYYKTDIKNI